MPICFLQIYGAEKKRRSVFDLSEATREEWEIMSTRIGGEDAVKKLTSSLGPFVFFFVFFFGIFPFLSAVFPNFWG